MSDSNSTEGGGAVGMFIAAYADKEAADRALAELRVAKDTGALVYDDAAVVKRDSDGDVHVTETGDLSTGKGAAIGALVGGVVALLAGPAGAAATLTAEGVGALGVGGGAAVGALAAHKDIGFDNDSLKSLGTALPPDTSALAVTTSQGFVEAARKEVPEERRMETAAAIAGLIGDRVGGGKDTLISLVLTDEGIAATEVTASAEELSAFGIVASGDGIAAGGASIS